MDNISALLTEHPNVVRHTITIGKKRRGRWRTPVKVELSIDKEFCERYNPKLPSWRELSIFKGHSVGCGIACETCKNNLHKTLGFAIYQEENPNIDSGCFDKLFKRTESGTCYRMQGYLEWKPGIPDHNKEIEILKEITRTLRNEVMDVLLGVYSSTEIEETNISIDEDEKNRNRETRQQNTTKRKININ